MGRKSYKHKFTDDSLISLFFDFYALNEIWFRTVGASIYGYPTTKVLPFNKERAIDEAFHAKVTELKKEVIRALEHSVRGEVRHWTDNTSNETGEESDKNGWPIMGTSGIKRRPSQRVLQALPLSSISTLFHAGCWFSDYGGKKWGMGTDALIALMNSKTIKDDIFYLDRIFDLQHNNGFILNKTSFAALEDETRALVVAWKPKRAKKMRVKKRYLKILDFRFKANLKDLVANASTYTKSLHQANLNYI
jgi:hypothetical protein